MRVGTDLDWMDLKILAKLQRAGRASNVEIADAVGLSPSPCLARVKRLQSIGVIMGYGAQLSLPLMGKFMIIFVEVTIDKHHRKDLRRFEEAASAVREILECYNVSGGYDYLLKIVTRDVEHFQKIMDDLINDDIGIDKFKSYIVLRNPFERRGYPIDILFDEKR